MSLGHEMPSDLHNVLGKIAFSVPVEVPRNLIFAIA